ncbi:MAG: F0F1 ATP synthase subunit B [Candidatus Moranbacteria bacterium]|nr:F0F1 ATP synthase subunit B [bacterium]MDP1833586.1 F0F1 ATP synthase subunit B [Candidatus Moranbacteria bacterium]
MELLDNLGIDGRLLLAQLINFVILLAVLYKFAYGPVLKILEERTKKIENGLKDAEESHKKLAEISEKEAAVLVEARKNAQQIIKKSEEAAVKNAEEIIVLAKDQSIKMLEQAKKQIEQEKEKILAEVKTEVAELIMVATGKIIDEKLDSEKDRDLINRSIK